MDKGICGKCIKKLNLQFALLVPEETEGNCVKCKQPLYRGGRSVHYEILKAMNNYSSNMPGYSSVW